MRVVFRADASVTQGSGHVMRCLTLAEELHRRGDEVIFASAIDSIPWLRDHLASTEFRLVATRPDELDAETLLALQPDWVVVDSYRIDAGAISALARSLPLLAIVDGERRGIEATLFLDQNLGAELGETDERMLAGAKFALLRDAILTARRPEPWLLPESPTLTAFMGGTDPTGTIVGVARALAAARHPFDATIVTPERFHSEVRAALGREATVVAPTVGLPKLLARADVVVSAAGTSAWDVCTLGVPALLVGVVDNQSTSLARAVEGGLVLGVDLVEGGVLSDVSAGVDRLLSDRILRQELSRSSTALFDGLGATRVADAMSEERRR